MNKLKPLKWSDVTEHDDWNPHAQARTILGTYYVSGIGDKWHVQVPTSRLPVSYSTRDEAKAAAFEHYKNLIGLAFEL